MRPRHPAGLLVVGPQNSGKTTVVDWLATVSSRSTRNDAGEATVTVPTVGFVARRFKFMSTPITALDMSGQSRYRSLWRYYLRQCDAIVYVVDAADVAGLPAAFADLRRLLSDCALVRRRPRLPLLLLGNKSDLPAPTNDFRSLADSLCRQACRPCHVVASSALDGTGLGHAFDWLLRQISALRPRWYHDNRPTWY